MWLKDKSFTSQNVQLHDLINLLDEYGYSDLQDGNKYLQANTKIVYSSDLNQRV